MSILDQLKKKLEITQGVSNVDMSADETITFNFGKYDCAYYRAVRASLTRIEPGNDVDEETHNVIKFLENGKSEEEAVKFILLNDEDPDQIYEWITRKLDNPVNDPELQEIAEKMKTKLEGLNISYLMEDRNIAIVREVEEYNYSKILSVSVQYNTIQTEDFVLFQIKKLFTQPGTPILYLKKVINTDDREIEESEYDPSKVAECLKECIILKNMELMDVVEEDSPDYKELQERLN